LRVARRLLSGEPAADRADVGVCGATTPPDVPTVPGVASANPDPKTSQR
jgi:hypothetical protein